VSYSLFLAVCTTTNLTLGTTLGGQATPSPPRYHLYKFIGDFNSVNQFEINIRMRFRAFKPHLLREDHPELLQNLPIFVLATLQDTLDVQSSP